jgi:RNA polymerase sigma factor (sigma-70 family)
MGMDPLLLRLWQETDEVERERKMEELLVVQAAPLIRLTLRQRFGVYVNANGENPARQEAADLYQEILTKILQGLRDLINSTSTPNIENFGQYVGRIVGNVHYDRLRANAPVRTRLKKIIRDLLQRHSSFAIWHSDGEILCGFSVWHEGSKSLLAERRLADLVQQEEGIHVSAEARNTRNRAALSSVIADIFEKVGGPVGLDGVVSLLSDVLDLKDSPMASLDEEAWYQWEAQNANNLRFGSRLELRETLLRIWQEILQLPVRQREALCFSFADSNGKDLITLLLESEVATFDEIAKQLGRSASEMSSLWAEMPLSSQALGELLGATPAQIYKWRFLALAKLRETLRSGPPEK